MQTTSRHCVAHIEFYFDVWSLEFEQSFPCWFMAWFMSLQTFEVPKEKKCDCVYITESKVRIENEIEID
jgi:hypothetical protein